MSTIHYSAECYGDGRTSCDWTHDGPGSDLAARKHEAATKHGTSTHARLEDK